MEYKPDLEKIRNLFEFPDTVTLSHFPTEDDIVDPKMLQDDQIVFERKQFEFLHFPLHPIYNRFFDYFGICPVQLHPTGYELISSYLILCKKVGLTPCLNDILSCYSLTSTKATGGKRFSLFLKSSARPLVTEKARYSGDWKNKPIIVGGKWKAYEESPCMIPRKFGKPSDDKKRCANFELPEARLKVLEDKIFKEKYTAKGLIRRSALKDISANFGLFGEVTPMGKRRTYEIKRPVLPSTSGSKLPAQQITTDAGGLVPPVKEISIVHIPTPLDIVPLQSDTPTVQDIVWQKRKATREAAHSFSPQKNKRFKTAANIGQKITDRMIQQPVGKSVAEESTRYEVVLEKEWAPKPVRSNGKPLLEGDSIHEDPEACLAIFRAFIAPNDDVNAALTERKKSVNNACIKIVEAANAVNSLVKKVEATDLLFSEKEGLEKKVKALEDDIQRKNLLIENHAKALEDEKAKLKAEHGEKITEIRFIQMSELVAAKEQAQKDKLSVQIQSEKYKNQWMDADASKTEVKKNFDQHKLKCKNRADKLFEYYSKMVTASICEGYRAGWMEANKEPSEEKTHPDVYDKLNNVLVNNYEVEYPAFSDSENEEDGATS